MDFAKNQLKKYGWVEGKGLGKEETGMVDAIKPKSKRSLGGLGHDMADEFTNQWWHRAYNNATSNIKIDSLENGEVKSFGTANDPKKDKTNMNKMPLYFQTFVQSAVLENGQTTHQEDNQIDNEVPQEIADSISEKSESESKLKHLTDDELFAACGKRTAHKGARHGLKFNGKLARLEMQEKELLSKIKVKSKHNKSKNHSKKKNSTIESLTNNDTINKSIVKRKKHKK